MNRSALLAAAAAGLLLGVTACTAQPAAEGGTASSKPTVAQVKASAKAAGRPAEAFDGHCEVWQTPRGSGPRQGWANEVGADWLASHEAGCPDAIAWPFYFVDAWDSPSSGTLRVKVSSTITRTDWPYLNGSADTSDLQTIAQDFMCRVSDRGDVSAVVAVTEDGKRQEQVTRADQQKREAKYGAAVQCVGR